MKDTLSQVMWKPLWISLNFVKLARSPSFIMTFPIYLNLLKTKQQISDFQHFYWLTENRLSVYIPAVPNMVKESISNKASRKHFCSSEEIKTADKSCFGPVHNEINKEELLTLKFLIKQLFYSGLLDIKINDNNQLWHYVYVPCWWSISSYPVCPHRAIITLHFNIHNIQSRISNAPRILKWGD